MLQWFLRFSEFPEFNESSAPFRENSNVHMYNSDNMTWRHRNEWIIAVVTVMQKWSQWHCVNEAQILKLNFGLISLVSEDRHDQ